MRSVTFALFTQDFPTYKLNISNFHIMKECLVAPKSVSHCPVLAHKKKAPAANFAIKFFTECPYGKRAQDQCPYGRKLSQANVFYTECPYGQRMAASKCPYAQMSHKRSHSTCKFYTECPYGQRLSSPRCPHSQYATEFFTECPYGQRVAATSCPYGQKLTRSVHNHNGFTEKFFTECPYGQRLVASECPYDHDIAQSDKTKNESRRESESIFVEELFTECPHGRRAAEDCPYGQQVLEKAGIEVSPLKNNEEPAKCPFVSMPVADQANCPVAVVLKVDEVS